MLEDVVAVVRVALVKPAYATIVYTLYPSDSAKKLTELVPMAGADDEKSKIRWLYAGVTPKGAVVPVAVARTQTTKLKSVPPNVGLPRYT